MDNYKVGDIMMRNGGNARYIITFVNANIICGINQHGFSFEIDNTNEMETYKNALITKMARAEMSEFLKNELNKNRKEE